MADATTPLQLPTPFGNRRQNWIHQVELLVEQIAGWSRSENWAAELRQKSITEKSLQTYTVPKLTIRLPEGELTVNPIGPNIAGGDGRVDLEAIPTLSRVKLKDGPGGWEVWTDSNVPLRVVWNHENFVRLVYDLLS